MTEHCYRYVFADGVPVEEAEATLVLALLTCEALHGEAQVRLDAGHHFDAARRSCVLDAATPVGRDLNKLFVAFLQHEFGPDGFRVERVLPELAASA
jgi:hypothetical protein